MLQKKALHRERTAQWVQYADQTGQGIAQSSSGSDTDSSHDETHAPSSPPTPGTTSTGTVKRPATSAAKAKVGTMVQRSGWGSDSSEAPEAADGTPRSVASEGSSMSDSTAGSSSPEEQHHLGGAGQARSTTFR